jgi:hypothetical protein
MDKNNKYKIVVLLCASELDQNGKFIEVETKNGHSLYLGGQVRMQAAIDFAHNVENYIVVGGSEKKVNDMKTFLENSFHKNKILKAGEPAPKIIRIVSEKDTPGNLWAIKFILQELGKLDIFTQGKIGIMTNFYHIPRTMRFATDIFKEVCANFIPICAEAVTTHQETFSIDLPVIIARLKMEINGLSDWEQEIYNKQERLTSKDWCHKCIDKDLLEELKI